MWAACYNSKCYPNRVKKLGPDVYSWNTRMVSVTKIHRGKKKICPWCLPSPNRNKRRPGWAPFLWKLLSFWRGSSRSIRGAPFPPPRTRGREDVDTPDYSPGREPAPSKAWPRPWQPRQTSKTSPLARSKLPETRGALGALSRRSEPYLGLVPPSE